MGRGVAPPCGACLADPARPKSCVASRSMGTSRSTRHTISQIRAAVAAAASFDGRRPTTYGQVSVAQASCAGADLAVAATSRSCRAWWDDDVATTSLAEFQHSSEYCCARFEFIRGRRQSRTACHKRRAHAPAEFVSALCADLEFAFVRRHTHGLLHRRTLRRGLRRARPRRERVAMRRGGRVIPRWRRSPESVHACEESYPSNSSNCGEGFALA